jgi:carbon monoxide dehydrogenase subunit G
VSRVQLEESFELPVAREAAWEAFRDVEMLVSCLPGATLTSGADADPLKIVFSVKLGPINASFTGQGSVVYNDDCSGSFSGGGADRATNSRVKGDAKFSLQEAEEGTRVQIVVDYALSGALAQFGRPGIVKEIASKLTQQFAANLRARLTESTAGEPGDASAQFDAGGVLVKAARGRIKRMFGGKDE